MMMGSSSNHFASSTIEACTETPEMAHGCLFNIIIIIYKHILYQAMLIILPYDIIQ